jgi:hypothetical protein
MGCSRASGLNDEGLTAFRAIAKLCLVCISIHDSAERPGTSDKRIAISGDKSALQYQRHFGRMGQHGTRGARPSRYR